MEVVEALVSILFVVEPRPVVVLDVGDIGVDAVSALLASLPGSIIYLLIGHGISQNSLPVLLPISELSFVEAILS